MFPGSETSFDDYRTGQVSAVALEQGSNLERPVAIDLFAGAGGLSLGAFLAGFTITAAVEKNGYACKTYRKNLIDTRLTSAKLFETDIQSLCPNVMLESIGLAPQACDILLGGPPCQGFSAHRIKDAGVGDPRNELLLRYIDFLRVIRPKYFLVENVPGILWPRHEAYLKSFQQLAASAGYIVNDPVTINAKDYGVPQNRRRVFILGRRADWSETLNWPPLPTHGPESNNQWVTAQCAFEPPPTNDDPNNIHMNHGPDLVEVFKSTPVNGGSRRDSSRQLACHTGYRGHNDVYGRICPSQPGPTMTTACCNPSKGRFVHPTQHHGITLRQAARIQSFPDWFVFEGGLTAPECQIGNAVPVKMAKELLTPFAVSLTTRCLVSC